MKVSIFLVGMILSHLSYCQNAQYKSLSKKADSLFLVQEYSVASSLYEDAIVANNGIATVLHRYRAATCYAVLNKIDSSFYHLFRIAEKGGFSQIDLLSNDYNFKVLHSDVRWNKLLLIVDQNRKQKEKY